MPRVDFSLYLVTDRTQTGGRPLIPLVRAALRAGLRAIQLREQELTTRSVLALARDLLGPAREAGAPLLINDRVDVAASLEGTGVHLRSSSLPVGAARKLLGPDRLIGVSTHTVDEVVRAEADGADFALLGPIYDTPSKRRYGPPIGLHPLEEAVKRCRMPVLAIGGITVARVREVRGAGAAGVAVVSAILAADDSEAATQALLAAAVQR